MKSRWLLIWPAAPDTAMRMVFFHVAIKRGSSCGCTGFVQGFRVFGGCPCSFPFTVHPFHPEPLGAPGISTMLRVHGADDSAPDNGSIVRLPADQRSRFHRTQVVWQEGGLTLLISY